MSDEAPEDLDWRPVRPGGAAFRTHRLVVVSPQRLELHFARGVYILVGSMLAVGVACFGAALWGFFTRNFDIAVALCAPGLMCLIIAVLVSRLHTTRVFDASLDRYWSSTDGKQPGPDALRLTDVRAVQILGEHVGGGEVDFDSYELNLVLADGRRVNVIDHSELAELHADACELAKFLRVPVWIAPLLRDRKELSA